MAQAVSDRVKRQPCDASSSLHTHVCKLSDAIALRLPNRQPHTTHFHSAHLYKTHRASPTTPALPVDVMHRTYATRRWVAGLEPLVAYECWFVSSLKTRFVSKYMSVGWSASASASTRPLRSCFRPYGVRSCVAVACERSTTRSSYWYDPTRWFRKVNSHDRIRRTKCAQCSSAYTMDFVQIYISKDSLASQSCGYANLCGPLCDVVRYGATNTQPVKHQRHMLAPHSL